MSRDWNELEQKAGIRRNVPIGHTQKDAERLHIKRLSVNKTWRDKFRRARSR